MIEAMACGTPVIAFPRGAVPEIIENGVNGFVVADEAEAVVAVGKLQQLPRAGVRARFLERFTSRRMAEDYLSIYAKLISVAPKQARYPAKRSLWPLTPAGGGQAVASLRELASRPAEAAASIVRPYSPFVVADKT
jgi:hypothetical protein